VPPFVPAVPQAPAVAIGGALDRVVVRLAEGVEVEAVSTDALPPSWLAAVARALRSSP
jgi:hypothetical protein